MVVLVRMMGFLQAPCRVVYVIDEPDIRGFAYGTLPGHPESGEERFVGAPRPEHLRGVRGGDGVLPAGDLVEQGRRAVCVGGAAGHRQALPARGVTR